MSHERRPTSETLLLYVSITWALAQKTTSGPSSYSKYHKPHILYGFCHSVPISTLGSDTKYLPWYWRPIETCSSSLTAIAQRKLLYTAPNEKRDDNPLCRVLWDLQPVAFKFKVYKCLASKECLVPCPMLEQDSLIWLGSDLRGSFSFDLCLDICQLIITRVSNEWNTKRCI